MIQPSFVLAPVLVGVADELQRLFAGRFAEVSLLVVKEDFGALW